MSKQRSQRRQALRVGAAVGIRFSLRMHRERGRWSPRAQQMADALEAHVARMRAGMAGIESERILVREALDVEPTR